MRRRSRHPSKCEMEEPLVQSNERFCFLCSTGNLPVHQRASFPCYKEEHYCFFSLDESALLASPLALLDPVVFFSPSIFSTSFF